VKEARERKRVVKENRRSIELERAMRLRTCKFPQLGLIFLNTIQKPDILA
jgi:hypothetical protein